MPSIARQYLQYQPVSGHLDGCTRGPDKWEVAQHTEYGFGERSHEVRSTSLRLSCPECGQIRLMGADGALSEEYTGSDALGWGSAPERVAGLWLWAGPPLLRGQGPDAYYVTTHKLRPAAPGHIAGIIGRGRKSARFNAAEWWFAGLGCNELGMARRSGPEEGFRSRTAAAKWLAGQIATRGDDLAEMIG